VTERRGAYRSRSHVYSWGDSGPLVGVTSILKTQDQLIGGDLPTWAVGRALDFVDANPDSTREQIMAHVNQARDLGSAVHARIEHILLDLNHDSNPTLKPCSLHPPEFGRPSACEAYPGLVYPYIYSFSAFLAARRPEFLMVEAMVFNLTHRFAGTFDIAAKIDRRMTLLDIKSGRTRKPSHRLQLAGYAAAEFIGKEDDDTRYPLPRFQDHGLLYLAPEGYEYVPVTITAADRRHFLYLADTYRRLRTWEGKEPR